MFLTPGDEYGNSGGVKGVAEYSHHYQNGKSLLLLKKKQQAFAANSFLGANNNNNNISSSMSSSNLMENLVQNDSIHSSRSYLKHLVTSKEDLATKLIKRY